MREALRLDTLCVCVCVPVLVSLAEILAVFLHSALYFMHDDLCNGDKENIMDLMLADGSLFCDK
jgi:hypothetical protein